MSQSSQLPPSIAGSQALSRRAVALGSIAALHLAVISLIASGLGSRLYEMVAPPITLVPVDPQPQRQDIPPPLGDPTLRKFKDDFGPQPDIPIEGDAGPTAVTVVAQPPAPPVADSRPAPPSPVRLVGRNELPNTSDFYPPVLIRQGIQGAAIVRVCVDEKGARRSEPAVEQSSGNALLDEAAVSVTRAGRYARAVQGDTPVPFCHRFHIGFNLK